MVLMKTIVVTTCLFAGGLISSDKAFAASSGWMDANQTKKFISKVLKRKNNLPTSIKCRNNSKTVGLSNKNMMTKIEYHPNPKGKGWGLALGAGHVGPFLRKHKKRRYVKVNSGGFRRKSGLFVPCVLWHQKS